MQTKNSMMNNPKLVALLERVDQLVIEKKANGMSGSSMVLNSAILQAADEYGVDLHQVEHAITFTGNDYPIVPSHECDLEATLIEGSSSTEYEAWLSTRTDIQARLENRNSLKNTGYEIWRVSWTTCRELAEFWLKGEVKEISTKIATRCVRAFDEAFSCQSSHAEVLSLIEKHATAVITKHARQYVPNLLDERELRDAVIDTLQRGGPDCVTDVMRDAVTELVHSAMRDATTATRSLLFRLGRWVFTYRTRAEEYDESRELMVELSNVDPETYQAEVISWRPAQ